MNYHLLVLSSPVSCNNFEYILWWLLLFFLIPEHWRRWVFPDPVIFPSSFPTGWTENHIPNWQECLTRALHALLNLYYSSTETRPSSFFKYKVFFIFSHFTDGLQLSNTACAYESSFHSIPLLLRKKPSTEIYHHTESPSCCSKRLGLTIWGSTFESSSSEIRSLAHTSTWYFTAIGNPSPCFVVES